MSASFGDQGVFDLFANWLKYRKRVRASARSTAELRDLSEQYLAHLDAILRCALAEDAADLVPDDIVLSPEEAIFLRRNPPGRAAKGVRPS